MQRNKTIADYLRTICQLPIYSKQIKRRPRDNHFNWVYASEHKQIVHISLYLRLSFVRHYRFLLGFCGLHGMTYCVAKLKMLHSEWTIPFTKQKPIWACSLWLFLMSNISLVVETELGFPLGYCKCADSTMKLKCMHVCVRACVCINYSV